MKTDKSLDILIPVFNEKQTIATTIGNIINTVKCEYTICICYDYDEDPTLKTIKENFPSNKKLVLSKIIQEV